jgi:hypothetical protein
MSTIRSAETGLRYAHARFGSYAIGHAMSSAGTPEGLCSSRLLLHLTAVVRGRRAALAAAAVLCCC